MYRLIRWYNQNRLKFYIGLAVITFAFLVLQVLDSIAEKEQEEINNNIQMINSSTNQSTTISKTDKSVITGEKISTYDDNINVRTINRFINYCNNGEIEEAYSMLSDECKEVIYPSIESFKSNYINKIFYIYRIYDLENWYKNVNLYTYYIKYSEDILSTGNVNSKDNKSDYITVVQEDDEYKLNISSYVGRKIKNTKGYNDNIYITLNWIDMYIDYSILNITINNNNSESTICIDTKEDVMTLHAVDDNGVKYSAFLNEIPNSQLVFNKRETRTLDIKVNMIYSTSRYLKGISFNDIVTNYDNYAQKKEGKTVTTIDIK